MFAWITFIFLSNFVFAQGWVEEKLYVSSRAPEVRIAGIYTAKLTRQTGTFVWFQADKSYGQSYAGLTYSPQQWLQVAAGVGLEQNKNPLRAGGFVALGSKKTKSLVVLEKGGSGGFWRVEFTRVLGQGFGLGGMGQSLRGVGPRLEYKLQGTPLLFWSGFFCSKKPVLVVGVRWVFN